MPRFNVTVSPLDAGDQAEVQAQTLQETLNTACGRFDAHFPLLLQRLNQLAPPAPAPQPEPPAPQIQALAHELKHAITDPSRYQEIVVRVSNLPKKDVVGIAKALNIPTNSKTTKTLALAQISSLAGAKARESTLAQKIARGG